MNLNERCKELKPCPFCGFDQNEDSFCKTGPYWIRCWNCQAETPCHDDYSIEGAIEIWNERLLESANLPAPMPEGVRETLVKAIAICGALGANGDWRQELDAAKTYLAALPSPAPPPVTADDLVPGAVIVTARGERYDCHALTVWLSHTVLLTLQGGFTIEPPKADTK